MGTQIQSSACKNIPNLPKKSSEKKKPQNPSRYYYYYYYYNSIIITNLKFQQHKPKLLSSFKNPHRKI